MARLICSFCGTVLCDDYPTELDSHGMCKKCLCNYYCKHDAEFASWYYSLNKLVDLLELTDLEEYPLWNGIVTLKKWYNQKIGYERAAYLIATEGI